MSAKANWKINLFKATTDPQVATPYTRVLLTTLAGYAGYATLSLFTTRSGLTPKGEASTTTDVSGTTLGAFRSIIKFDVKLWPLLFNASSEPDLDDAAALRTFIDGAPYLWAQFLSGSRLQPSATEAYPVIVTEFSETVNESGGVHEIEMTLLHKYQFATY